MAGAVISGAYFGDKLSPLSDTTNLAPAVAGELFGHIRYMLNTTLPSMGIALLLFGGIGLFGGPARKASTAQLDQVVAAIREHVRIGWYCYLPPVVVVVLIARRMAALPALFIGTLAGLVVAVVFQGQLLESPSAGTGWRERYRVLMNAPGDPHGSGHGFPAGGRTAFREAWPACWNRLADAVCAMTFGGDGGAGLLQRITRGGDEAGEGRRFVDRHHRGQLCLRERDRLGPVPGHRGARPDVCSGVPGTRAGPEGAEQDLGGCRYRDLALVPWNTCGAYQAGVLGVATMTYLPFCFFNLASP